MKSFQVVGKENFVNLCLKKLDFKKKGAFKKYETT